jgi:hypothetical protein
VQQAAAAAAHAVATGEEVDVRAVRERSLRIDGVVAVGGDRDLVGAGGRSEEEDDERGARGGTGARSCSAWGEDGTVHLSQARPAMEIVYPKR